MTAGCTVHVTASRDYDVRIGSGLLPLLGQEIRTVTHAAKAALVSDSHVFPLYGQTAAESLKKSGLDVCTFVFPAGESSKNGETYWKLLNFLAENHLTRSDCVVALGGGVVGDLAGFGAATYLRGIPLIQVPTTLLAAVDSSVGGKTAIDLPAGKNLAGAFCQPHLVLCDLNCLQTLPPEIFRDGCAEVIKYAILYDPELFRHLQEHGLDFDRLAVVSRCVQLKRDVVAGDEFDTGARQMLNLGHTIGHGIEAASAFAISHGRAVAAGMAIVARAAQKQGLCSASCTEKILALLRDFGLPTTCDFDAAQLAHYALSDKKRSGGTVNLIVPRRIGCCAFLPTPVEELQQLIQGGLSV